MDRGDILELSRHLRRRSLDLIGQSHQSITRCQDLFAAAMEARLRSADACAHSAALRHRSGWRSLRESPTPAAPS